MLQWCNYVRLHIITAMVKLCIEIHWKLFLQYELVYETVFLLRDHQCPWWRYLESIQAITADRVSSMSQVWIVSQRSGYWVSHKQVERQKNEKWAASYRRDADWRRRHDGKRYSLLCRLVCVTSESIWQQARVASCRGSGDTGTTQTEEVVDYRIASNAEVNEQIVSPDARCRVGVRWLTDWYV